MYARGNRRQTIGVLLASFLLIILCIGGLWMYIKSADAETGVQETAVATLPEEENISITWEKYDNYPANGKEEDLEQKFIGTGLTRKEKERLPALIEAYTNKTGPGLRFPARFIPDVDGLAIVPLDPMDYAGMTEYYILPSEALDDQQMMQLIDYSAQKGETFTAETLTSKNCMRGGHARSNRYFSAGEEERRDILIGRIQMEGLRPVSPALSQEKLPVKGMASLPLRADKHSGIDEFHFYPIREMTDIELMQSVYLTYESGYTYLKPAEDDSLKPAKDLAKVRALLEKYMGMPMAAKNYALGYIRKDATGEIRLRANFQTALVNGKRVHYFVNVDYKTGLPLNIDQFTWIKSAKAVSEDATGEAVKSLSEAELLAITRSLVEDVSTVAITSVVADGVVTPEQIDDQNDEEIVSEHVMIVHVELEDGNQYLVNIRVSDGVVIVFSYRPVGEPEQFMW